MTEPLQERMEVWNMYHGLQFAKDYQLASNGVKYPTKFQAVWNYPDGDFVYFDGSISEISYGYK